MTVCWRSTLFLLATIGIIGTYRVAFFSFNLSQEIVFCGQVVAIVAVSLML
jgi:hypothetical protein